MEAKKDTKDKKLAEKQIEGIGKNRSIVVKPSIKTVGSCTRHYTSQVQEDQYQCNKCGFTTEWACEYFKHMPDKHALQVPHGNTDPVIFFLAEQNEAIVQKMNDLTKEIKDINTKVYSINEQLEMKTKHESDEDTDHI